jgi:hypothetical protein
MLKRNRTSMLESVPFLVLLGILAGAVGGLGIGLVQSKTSSSSVTTTK